MYRSCARSRPQACDCFLGMTIQDSHEPESSSTAKASLGAEEEDGNADAVLDAGGGSAQKQIGKEAVPVGAHGYQIAAFLLDPFDDFLHWITVGQLRLGGNAEGLELFPDVVQIGCVFGDLAADRIRAIGSGGPSVGDVEQHQPAVG